MNRLLTIFLLVIFASSCTENHFIKDKNYRKKVEAKFKARKELAKNRSNELFDVFSEKISTREREALMFLYAYMPLCDLADYDGNFFLKQVKTAFEARAYFSWGETIPDEVFRHFVLPYRVNNENLDSARWVFFNELKERIKDMSMKEAALEVNHWCHEKVNYQSTDIRTSSPLCTVKTSYARCGEESTFTVTALRAVGIPARQVYTPRWAHCDDNHAWVEVWVDGEWHYLGACEPEPDLDIAWFTEPARRAMLVHTKVFGDYTSNDEIVRKDENFTEINVISNYAETKTIYVKVVQDGQALPNARVDFGLYNYAEFYPIASKTTDETGIASLTTGLGDLLIWSSKDDKYSFAKVSVKDIDTLVQDLSSNKDFTTLNLNFHPPIEKTPFELDSSNQAANKKQLAYEDSIRYAYRATFIDSAKAFEFAARINLDKDKTWKYLNASQGNWHAIKKYLTEASKANVKHTFELLEQISAKDLRDADANILLAHLLFNYEIDSSEKKKLFAKYILNPRIKNEKLTDYKKRLGYEFKDYKENSLEKSIKSIKEWVANNISINKKDNYYNLPITPLGVLELKIANEESRNIFFVAICRSLGIASRLEPATKIPQFFNGEKWKFVYFEQQKQSQPQIGHLIFDQTDIKTDFNPQYYKHFTIARLNKGRFETLDFGWDTKLSEMPDSLKLEIGNYRLITGMRQKDGSILTQLSHFEITKNKTTKVKLTFRKTAVFNLQESTQIENELAFQIGDKKQIFPKEGKSLVLIWLDPNGEPSKHLIKGFKRLKNELEQVNSDILLFVNQDNKKAIENIKSLPKTTIIVKEETELNSKLWEKAGFSSAILPAIMVLDKKKNLIFKANGYNTSIADEILKFTKNRE